MVAVALGLAASVSWGLADFIGGVKARALELVTVLVVSQGLALVLLATAVAVSGVEPPSSTAVAAAAGAGAAGVLGLAALYRGLAVGAMAVVAPIAALGAALPVGVGIATGIARVVCSWRGSRWRSPAWRWRRGRSRPRAAAPGWQLAPAWPPRRRSASACSSWAWMPPATTACCGRSSSRDSSASGCCVIAVLASRPDLHVARPDLAALAAIGVLDLAANGLFALAANEGLVSVASVCSSLYPVVTIILARAVLSERVRPSQQVGVALVMAGVVGIAAG